MAWYNPKTWGKKETPKTPSPPSTTRFVPGGGQSVAPQTPEQAVKTALTPKPSSGGGGGGGGGGLSAPSQSMSVGTPEQIAGTSTQTNPITGTPLVPPQKTIAQQLQEKVAQKKAQTDAQKQSTQPYLIEKQTGTFKYGGRTIPETGLFYVSSTGEERKATRDEEQLYRSQPQVLIASDKKRNVFDIVGSKINVGKEWFGERTSRGAIGKIKSFITEPIVDEPLAGPVGSYWLAAVVGATTFPKPASVKFVGATQQGVQPIQTDVVFEVGGKKGAARGFTYTKDASDVSLGLTRTKGQFVGSKVDDFFIGQEISISKGSTRQFTKQTDLFSVTKDMQVTESFGLGVGKGRGLTTPYITKGLSTQKDSLIGSVAIAQTKQGQFITSTGVLKVKAQSPSTFFRVTEGSGLTGDLATIQRTATQIQRSQALVSTQSAVASSQPIKFVLPESKFFSPTAQVLSQEVLKAPSLKVRQENVLMVGSTTGLGSALSLRQITESKQETKAMTSLFSVGKTKTRQGQIPALSFVQSPALKQDTFLVVAQIQKTPLLTPKPFIFPKTPVVPPFLPGLPKIFDFGLKRKSKQREVKGRYTPSVGAVFLDIKAPKISRSYKMGAGALGIRPIIGKGKSSKNMNPFKNLDDEIFSTKSKGRKKSGRKRK